LRQTWAGSSSEPLSPGSDYALDLERAEKVKFHDGAAGLSPDAMARLRRLWDTDFCASSRNGALHIGPSWRQTGIESRRASHWRELLHWNEEGHVDFIPAVVSAEYRGEFKIRVVFNDGVEGTIDFSDWLTGSVFEPLKDRTYFARFFIEGGTVTWPNGADIVVGDVAAFMAFW
jgi:hypothetical protein